MLSIRVLILALLFGAMFGAIQGCTSVDPDLSRAGGSRGQTAGSTENPPSFVISGLGLSSNYNQDEVVEGYVSFDSGTISAGISYRAAEFDGRCEWLTVNSLTGLRA